MLRSVLAVSVASGIVLSGGGGACAQSQEARQHFSQAEQLNALGRADEAIGEYRQAVSLDPSYVNAWFNLGNLYAAKREWQTAAESYNRVVELNPDDGEAHFSLAAAYGALRRPSDALRHYDRSQALGVHGDPALGELLEPYRQKRVLLNYAPVSDPAKTIPLTIQGNSLGNELLRTDVLRNLELVDDGLKNGVLKVINVQFDAWENDDTWWERWVLGEGASSRSYRVRFIRSPGGGTDIQIHL